MSFVLEELVLRLKAVISVNGHSTGAIQHRTHHLTSHSQPNNLQKLLMNGNGVTSTTSGNINTISIPAIAQHGNGSRLAPGGAELNLLPPNSNGAVYRNQSKLIMKGELMTRFLKLQLREISSHATYSEVHTSTCLTRRFSFSQKPATQTVFMSCNRRPPSSSLSPRTST